MSFYAANFEFIRMKEIFKGNPEWEKAFALFHCLTLRDRDTAEHSIEVGYYAAKTAEKLGIEPSRYFLAGLLHDIGKINMDDHPLKSDQLLTKKERLQLKDHVLQGVLTLSGLGFGKDIIQFCLRHHERLDGSGYPFGVDEKNISIEGKIAQIADVYSALTMYRDYRKTKKIYTANEALVILKKETVERGTFDPGILNVFEEIITEEMQADYQYA